MADGGELTDRRLLAVREIGVAIAELLGQVELESLGERGAPFRGGTVEGEALEHLLGRAQVALAIPAPLGLAALERGSAANRDEDVLQQRASRMMRVDVAGRDRLDTEVLGEIAQETEPPRIPPLERALELDVEALATECACKTRGRVRVEQSEAAARAAGKAYEPLVQLGDDLERHRRGQRLAVLAPRAPRSRMRCREQAAQVPVPAS